MEESVFLVRGIISEEDCEKLRAFIDQRASNETGIHKFVNVCEFFNLKTIDRDATQTLFELIAPSIPKELGVAGVSKYLTMARYQSGEGFGLHTDTGITDPDTQTHTGWTYLIYLNDDYEGGETQFYDDNFSPTIRVKPEAGMALFFDIEAWHSAEPITRGTKYWIGTELMKRRQLH